ncbi:MAG: hypothetical protein ABIZ07_13045, partial [Dermatophilaceae bacterium]
HHVVCRACGEISDVECAVGERPCLHASNDHGYVIDEAEVIYWGVCPACQVTGEAVDEPRTDAQLRAEPAQRHTK